MVLSFGVNRLSRQTTQLLFWAFAAAMGASLANIFLIYAGGSIARVFFVSAGTFAAMSIWGYTTKTDLTRFGSLPDDGPDRRRAGQRRQHVHRQLGPAVRVSVIGVLVFVGLTAYDTQRIKNDYVQYSYAQGTDGAAVRSVYDALTCI